MSLIKCKECEKEISSEAKTCPSCGAKVKQKSFGSKAVICAGISLIINPLCILSILAIIFGIIALNRETENKGWTITSIIISTITLLFYIAYIRTL